jgi:hypothetical protein
VSAALLALLLATQRAPAASLPFLHDDWPRALEQAKVSHRPLVVETWAPW